MKTRARIFGHPIHLVLIVFPLGLLATSFFFDLAWLATGRAQLGVAAHWMIFAGVIGGVVASIFGVIDWLAIPREAVAWKVGALHGGGNAVVAILFAISWLLRRAEPGHPEWTAICVSAVGVLLIVVTGWLGSEVAERM